MKHWYESKTIWVNVISLVALILTSLLQWPELQEYAPQLLGAVNVLNIALRFLTTGSIKTDA